MPRTVTETVEVTSTLIAARCTIRRYVDGETAGDIEFAGLHKLTGPAGEDLGTREARVLKASFESLAGKTFPVVMPSGATVNVAGSTILDALESVYDYLREQAAVPETGP